MNLQQENVRLKWIIAQFMQRYKLDEVTFDKLNQRRFAIKFEDDPHRNLLIIKVKLNVEDKPADTDRGQGLN